MHKVARPLVRRQGGFTIVETLIVVAVSAALLASAVILVAGKQRKVEFTQSAQDMQSRIQQVISEVGTGYYPNNNVFTCSANSSAVTITAGAGSTQGSNTNCIFLGRAFQLGNGNDKEAFVLHTVAGYQKNIGTLGTAVPTAVDLDAAREAGMIRNGVSVVGMRYTNGATTSDISAIAFLQGLGNVDSNENFISGSQSVQLVPLRSSGSVGAASVATVVNSINTQLNDSAPTNPSGGVQICLKSGGTDQWAQITIGSNGRSLSVTLDYKNSVCW